MDNVVGLLKIRVKRGKKLAVRDITTSDPYVVITMGHQSWYEELDLRTADGNHLMQTVKTRVIKKNCNPQWNEELTLSISDLHVPIKLTVYDKDKFTGDDEMGEAEIDIQPYVASLKMGLKNLPNGCVISRVQPNMTNCLADESSIVWDNGRILQDMQLKLRKVETGELEVQIEWINAAGCKGLVPEAEEAPRIRVKRID